MKGMDVLAATGWWAWIAFLASWWLAAFWVDRAVKRGAAAKRLGYLIGFTIGFALLFGVVGGPHLRMLRVLQGAMLAAELAGFGFAWWARLHLGRLWSGGLTIREGHRIVDSGPYRLVRHPIYTGFIAAAWAFALTTGSATRIAGALVLTVVMTVKAAEEERWLRDELGPADYDGYAARTRMLIPLPRRDIRR